MDVGIVGKEAFLCGVEEVGTVVDAGLLTGRATKDLGLPGIAESIVSLRGVSSKRKNLQMAVEVNDTDRTVLTKALLSILCSDPWVSRPYRLIERSNGRVIVWSPPSVIKRGSVFPFLDGPGLSASVCGARLSSRLWPSSICCSA